MAGLLNGAGGASCPLCNQNIDHGTQLAGGRWQVKDGKLVPSEYQHPISPKPPDYVPDYSETVTKKS